MMKATETIRQSLEMSRQWFMSLVSDLKDAPTASGPAGHHALWALGHVAYGEKGMITEMVLGKPHEQGPYDELFGIGSQPQADPGRYPSFEKLMQEFENARAETLRVLDSLTDADLERPSQVPEDMKDFFGTVGQCLNAAGLHCTFHAGQVADTRRALGRKPLFG
jgi:hypothetical protein